jgi:DNA-binding MarR family transcriptional regulator
MDDEARTDVPLEWVMHIAAFRASLRSFLRETEHAARAWGLTPQRYALLLAVKGAPDGSQRLRFTDIAERLQLSRNATSDLVARAEDAGLVEREPSTEDARVTYVRATPDGERRLHGVIAASDADRRMLIASFDELAESFHRAAHRPQR